MSNCSNRCAVADALREAQPHAVRIRVDMQSTRWTDTKRQKRYIYLTPARAQQYVIAFDAGDKIKPFAFQLRIQGRHVIPCRPMPAEVQKALGERNQGAARLKVSKKQVVEKIGGKAPPVPGSSTVRGYGIRGLRVNQNGKASINGLGDQEDDET